TVPPDVGMADPTGTACTAGPAGTTALSVTPAGTEWSATAAGLVAGDSTAAPLPLCELATTNHMASSSTAAHATPTNGVTSLRGSARRSACGICVRSGGGGRDSRAV